MIDLLSPVGNFECLKAAVQNGADSVYFGGNMFSARAFANNFSFDELKKAIEYAKLRGVKTNLTLNTLIKDDEIDDAFELAKRAYEYGIDAIIVQDLGLAKLLIKHFPDLPIHGSTQMSVHNLNGVLELEKLGFKRVVLSRELSLNEIEYICNNSNIELECFIHGALCISYSGQCLFSSMVGGRSGNRGKCAQPCRLPYELFENEKKIDSGYLLSPRDLCGLDYIPFLISSGVSCLKIEGRMKSPEYVAIVTKIYRKYIDLAMSGKPYVVNKKDKKELMQVFNRGQFSSGHFESEPNKNFVFKDKSNNMGLFLGNVQKYNKSKGLVTIKLKEKIELGDTISLQNENGTYTISELMENNKNITVTTIGQIVTIGRMKGNISLGDKIYKLSSKSLNTTAKESYKTENRKIKLNCKVLIKRNKPISIIIKSNCNLKEYANLNISCTLPYVPVEAKNRPLSEDIIIKQLLKTSNTPYEFENISIDLDNNLFVSKLSILNELRRTAIQEVQNYALSQIHRNTKLIKSFSVNKKSNNTTAMHINKILKYSLLLNILDLEIDYSKLENIDNIYIPLKYFANKNYANIIKLLSEKFNTYIYLPTIIKLNYKNLFYNCVENSLNNFNIKGFVISNIGNIELIKSLYFSDNFTKSLDIIANYTLNIFNSHTIMELKKLGVSRFTISPELDKKTILTLCQSNFLPSELIIYGKTPLMNTNYCLLGKTDKCYPDCKQLCNTKNNYFLKDRLNLNFTILPDNIQTVTTIYNSKTTSLSANDFSIDYARIDILHENINEINDIILKAKSGTRFEGKEYTNGNINKVL